MAAVKPGTPDHVVLIEEADDVVVHALLGDVSGELVQVVGDLTIGKVFQKNLGCLEASFTGREEGWCLLLISKRGKSPVNTRLNQCKRVNTSHLAPSQSHFKYLVVLHVFVGTVLQQHHSSLHVVDSRGPVKSRFT